nr:hypothetical protein [Pseudomonas sp. A29(2023)]
MRSDKPEAQRFQDWVTRDVLPAIRKDGAYIMGEEGSDRRDGRGRLRLEGHRDSPEEDRPAEGGEGQAHRREPRADPRT